MGGGLGAAEGRRAGGDGDQAGDLRARVARYLREHHTMTIATAGPQGGGGLPAAGSGGPGSAGSEGAASQAAIGLMPHAASVFYAVDDALRLVFLSKPTSMHGLHIGREAPVAVTVTEQYDDWELIQGVQLWGVAKRVTGAAKVAAMSTYLRRFPFVSDLMEQPRLAASLRNIAVYRVTPGRIAFTDNTTGVFGREVLDLKG